jgi:molybdenum cofactor biosynthesis enzyme MoaA
MFTESMWNKISHNRFGWIRVSVDGATKETYEKIRVNGQWETINKNLELISRLRKEGHFESFGLHCVVMKSNHTELVEIAEKSLALHCDTIHFIRISGGVAISENINLTKNYKVLSRIAHLLDNPVFSNPAVDINEIKSYKQFKNIRVSAIMKIKTFVLATVLKIPFTIYYAIRFRAPIGNIWLVKFLRFAGKI